jgi:hypothetical protein
VGTAKIEHLEARLRKKDEVIAAVTVELVRTKKNLGRTERTMAHPDERDAVVDFLKRMNALTELSFAQLLP